MGDWTDKAWNERKRLGDLVEQQTTRYRALLFQESAGESAKQSSPALTTAAADRLAKIKTRLGELRSEIYLEEIDRDSYWTGPAATLFGDTVAAYLSLMDDLGKLLGEYEATTRTIVADEHQTAQTGFEKDLDNIVYKRWSAINKDGRGTNEFSSLWTEMYHPAYWRDKNSTNSSDEERRFNAALPRYQKAVGELLHDAKTSWDGIVKKLSDSYEKATPKYRPMPPGPDFSTVTVKKDSDDESDPTKDDKDDPFDLSSLLGGGGDGLSDLLGGGDGPGGGLGDGLSGLGGGLDASGGGLDRGGLGGGGLDGLGGGGLDGLGGGLDGGTGQDGLGGLGGYDVTGNGIPDVGPGGLRLPTGDLPAGSRVVRRPDGSTGIDLNGDGVADVDMKGRALPGGDAPEGSRLVTGPDGTTGYDITGNDVPDLGLDLRPLPGGDLPDGSSLVTTPAGTRGIDLDGDGVADVGLDGRALPGGNAPTGGRLVTGPDGQTGFDLDGDGIPDRGVDGRPIAPDLESSPDPSGRVPGDQVRLVADDKGGKESAGVFGGGGQGGFGYPPPIPPAVGAGAGGGNNDERERQTWLQEDDAVWTDDVVPVTALGRPGYDEEDEEFVDEWAAPPRRPRGASRPQRPTPGNWPPGVSRR
ncbi:hypothetical protein GCM10027280_18500 [Micromonospora polyrhachis]|uniref:Uncharacterized protein n=1 Tax=Micromonospora polyrhachis TaxID=1282883 RepID=A0A7W7WML6_9ACTN|nr:hypothetical protein [Micromonospora polyrhachis]MBB4956945.1 hypothetical protein [Micromonospora polyrhachis]